MTLEEILKLLPEAKASLEYARRLEGEVERDANMAALNHLVLRLADGFEALAERVAHLQNQTNGALVKINTLETRRGR